MGVVVFLFFFLSSLFFFSDVFLRDRPQWKDETLDRVEWWSEMIRRFLWWVWLMWPTHVLMSRFGAEKKCFQGFFLLSLLSVTWYRSCLLGSHRLPSVTSYNFTQVKLIFSTHSLPLRLVWIRYFLNSLLSCFTFNYLMRIVLYVVEDDEVNDWSWRHNPHPWVCHRHWWSSCIYLGRT